MREARETYGRQRRQRPRKLLLVVAICGALLAGVGVALFGLTAGANVTAPTSPPAGSRLCDGGTDSSALKSPYTSAPAGSVTIPAGNDSVESLPDGVPISDNWALVPNTTYWFAAGTHTFGSSQYSSIEPQKGDTFLGAPGAILNGEGISEAAFYGTVTGVTIEYLTIENFVPPTGQMVVNHDGGASWTVEYDTIAFNRGAGVGLGSNDTVAHNCLADNDEYGFSSFGGSSDVTLTDNDIADNNTNGTYDQQSYVSTYAVSNNVATIVTRSPLNLLVGGKIDLGASGGCSSGWCANLSDTALDGAWTIASVNSPTEFTFDVTTANKSATSDPAGTVSDPQATCGCSGGGKFWDTSDVTMTDNWIQGNGDVGLWADTDNAGFDISGNYIASNWGEGVMYEISYNASITDNGFYENALGLGPSPAVSGAIAPALYISESGSDSRVSTSYNSSFAVSNNAFVDNWAGVVAYENSNRACGITNDAYCTLVAPSTYTLGSCASNLPNGSTSDTPDYVDNCRWKTQNLDVTDNLFDFTPSDIGSDCTNANYCGYNGLFSEVATTPGTIWGGSPLQAGGASWPSGATYPYSGYTVPNNISNHQDNHFSDNEYCAGGGAAWNFTGFAQGNNMSQTQWTSGETNAADSGDSFGGQDSGSTFSSSACSTTTPTTTTTTEPSTTTSNPPTTTTEPPTTSTTEPPTTSTTEPPTTSTTEPPTTSTTEPPTTSTTEPPTTSTTEPPTTSTTEPPTTSTTEPPTTSTTEPPTTSTTEPPTTSTTEPPTTTAPTTSPPAQTTPAPQVSRGYDLVGHDGGVFVFPGGQSGGFYGSLPGLGVKVNDIVGMVPSPDDQGYFLVGADGGVFAFGDAPFLGSLPQLGISVNDIVAIASTSDSGYLLVDEHGGVYAFGDAEYEGSLPEQGVMASNVVGIAMSPSGAGYWLVGSDGKVYTFGDAPYSGSVSGAAAPVSGIVSTSSGDGYWIVASDGGIAAMGDARFCSSLPGVDVTPAKPIVGMVPTADSAGYWLIGSDGGVFAFGDAGYLGSLPSVGISVSDIAGAVETSYQSS